MSAYEPFCSAAVYGLYPSARAKITAISLLINSSKGLNVPVSSPMIIPESVNLSRAALRFVSP